MNASRTPNGTTRWTRNRAAIAAFAALVVATVATLVGAAAVTSPASALGHDPSRCRPDDTRVSVPSNFFLDTCFDGSYITLANHSSLPIYVNLRGDLRKQARLPKAGLSNSASTVAITWAPHLLPPDYEMRVNPGDAGGHINLGLADDTTRKYEMVRQFNAATLVSLAGEPDVVAAWLNEMDDAFLQLTRCVRGGGNFLRQSWCRATFMGDSTFAVARFGLNSVLTLAEIKQLVTFLVDLVYAGKDLRGLGGDLDSWYSAGHDMDVPAGLYDRKSAGGTGSQSGSSGSSNEGGSGGSGPPGTVSLSIEGSCTSAGGTLRGSSSGFTPGASAHIRAWYPNGSEYTNLTHTSRVRSDGSIAWSWPCAGDPAGQYTTSAVDNPTGRSTGRVAFAIGSSPTSGGGGVSPPSTMTEQTGTKGSGTFTNPHNASGEGIRIDAMTDVQVACRLYDPTVPSSNPDGWWYRIASSPWNGAYYSPAKNFWNGDVPGQTPYTHNTDFNVPVC